MGDVAQSAEGRTDMPLTPVRFPCAARDFSPIELTFSADSGVCTTRVQSQKTLQSISGLGRLCKH